MFGWGQRNGIGQVVSAACGKDCKWDPESLLGILKLRGNVSQDMANGLGLKLVNMKSDLMEQTGQSHQPTDSTLPEKVYSITGGASGNGLATAKLLAREGAAAIWIADVQAELFDKARSELNETNNNTKIYLDRVDVGDSAQVHQWVQRMVSESGGIHGSANAAGIVDPVLPMGRRGTGSRPPYGRGVATHLSLRAMLKMEKVSNPAIVNVASIAALTTGMGGYAYGASKAACDYFNQSVAKDGFGRVLGINSVLPGPTLTPLSKDRATNGINGRRGTTPIYPEDVARTIVWLLSEHSFTVNGASVPVGQGRP
ncbi:hypothetical protein PgNI_05463 [Pyricularia grisea]|uniref:Uncharacterized protein n=1 Tax=Pyricularia grisea TaxID=148305 RepID=A0A6P8B7N8_PYRGI|nr:hypothetical protein PgNI_05463 [Pyricularia grisea]TLD11139.1 hypothetical protein PgNI_05463 [Pyricularia grisea]